MNQVLHLLDKMRDSVLQMEYAVKKDDITARDFDNARDLMREHEEYLSELRSSLAMAEDEWRNS